MGVCEFICVSALILRKSWGNFLNFFLLIFPNNKIKFRGHFSCITNFRTKVPAIFSGMSEFSWYFETFIYLLRDFSQDP